MSLLHVANSEIVNKFNATVIPQLQVMNKQKQKSPQYWPLQYPKCDLNSAWKWQFLSS